MNKLVRFNLFVIVLLGITLIGCQNENSVNPVEDQKAEPLLKVGRTTVWADCALYNSVVTPGTFKPDHGKFDQLYAANFKDGYGLISDAKPGDQDYNGGRWHMNVLKAGVDPNKYTNACSAEDLDLNDFESSGNYFECPLLPRRNR